MATRRTLPSQSLAELATRAQVPLPPAFRAPRVPAAEADAVRSAAQAALVSSGACTPDGALVPELAETLPVLRRPMFTVDVTLTGPPGADDAPVDPSAPATAWTATFAGDADRVVGLLRRDVLPVVELSVSAPVELPSELHRLLDTLPGPVRVAPAPRVLAGFDDGEFARLGAGREDVVPLDLLTHLDGLRRSGGATDDVDRLAETAAVRPDQVRAVLTLLDTVDASLDVRVTSHARTVTVGQLLRYRTPSGWRSLEAAPDVVDPTGRRMARIATVASDDVVGALAPLLADALASTITVDA